MEFMLLGLILGLQVSLLILLIRRWKDTPGNDELFERIEERIRQLEQETGERVDAACDAGREELTAIVGSLRSSVDELAAAVHSQEKAPPVTEESRGISPADELRPLLRELAESMDARLGEIAELAARGGAGNDEDVLTAALGGKGYERISYVDPPRREGSRIEAVIEARRAGMTYKGKVAIEDGEVVIEDLSPMHRIFP